MPNQSLLYTGRVLASSQLNAMMHLCRELCGGQICVTPDFAAFQRDNAELFEKNALTRWYRPERLASDAARRTFLLPDCAP